MSLQRSNTADKNIVDRSKRHRNTDVARAVRKTRDKLSQQVGNPDFDRELLKLHARAMVGSAIALPLLVLAISAAGLFASMSGEILVWALITVACYAALALLALRIDRMAASVGLPEDRVLPFFLDADATPVAGGFPKGGVTQIDLPNNHLQYAITWYGLALALEAVTLAGFFRRKSP